MGDTEDTDSIPGSGRSPIGGNGEYSCLENAMDRGAWWATDHGVTKSWTCTSHMWDLGSRGPAMLETQVQSLGWEDPLEKEMVTHSSILAWRILWTKEPGGLQSMGLQRVRHD